MDDELDSFDINMDRLIKNAKEDIKNMELLRIKQHQQYLKMLKIKEEMDAERAQKNYIINIE
jgi:hypothetical protein